MPENDYVLYPLGFLQSPLKEPGEAPGKAVKARLTHGSKCMHQLQRGLKLLQ